MDVSNLAPGACFIVKARRPFCSDRAQGVVQLDPGSILLLLGEIHCDGYIRWSFLTDTGDTVYEGVAGAPARETIAARDIAFEFLEDCK